MKLSLINLFHLILSVLSVIDAFRLKGIMKDTCVEFDYGDFPKGINENIVNYNHKLVKEKICNCDFRGYNVKSHNTNAFQHTDKFSNDLLKMHLANLNESLPSTDRIFLKSSYELAKIEAKDSKKEGIFAAAFNNILNKIRTQIKNIRNYATPDENAQKELENLSNHIRVFSQSLTICQASPSQKYLDCIRKLYDQVETNFRLFAPTTKTYAWHDETLPYLRTYMNIYLTVSLELLHTLQAAKTTDTLEYKAYYVRITGYIRFAIDYVENILPKIYVNHVPENMPTNYTEGEKKKVIVSITHSEKIDISYNGGSGEVFDLLHPSFPTRHLVGSEGVCSYQLNKKQICSVESKYKSVNPWYLKDGFNVCWNSIHKYVENYQDNMRKKIQSYWSNDILQLTVLWNGILESI